MKNERERRERKEEKREKGLCVSTTFDGTSIKLYSYEDSLTRTGNFRPSFLLLRLHSQSALRRLALSAQPQQAAEYSPTNTTRNNGDHRIANEKGHHVPPPHPRTRE